MFAVIVVILCVLSAATPEDRFVQDWEKQYQELSDQITRRQSLAKTGTKGQWFESQAFDRQALILSSDKTPFDIQLRRTKAMLAKLAGVAGVSDYALMRKRLLALESGAATAGLAKTSAGQDIEKSAYYDLMKLQRQIAFANPAVAGFNDILFVEFDICQSTKPVDESDLTIAGDHCCDQYFGCNGKAGGGLYLLKKCKTTPTLVNIVQESVVQNGRLAGQKITGGAFLSPELSFDASVVLFAWAKGVCKKSDFSQDANYHLFKVNIDGSNLVQLTDGPYNDFDPCYLPGGRIVFISDRRGGYGRCHGRPVPTYTLYSMRGDGSGLFPLSWHETNEWQPSVTNDGRIVYTRWDYIDRDAVIAHHLWFCYPDGRDPRSFHGNYPNPQTTLIDSSWADGRYARPDMELHIRAIPNSTKYVATAAPHHSQAYGSLVIIDPDIIDDNAMSQVRRLTPDEPFPELETPSRGVLHKYATPWPLGEDQYLCNYQYSIVLLDKSGVRQALYTTETNDGGITGNTFGFRPIDPIPVMARKKPPELAIKTCQGEDLKPTSPNATIGITNVYLTDSFGTLPAGVKITQMRIVQVIPKSTPFKDDPKISNYTQSLVRMPIGTVPVESDGSVYCEAPVGREIYFQMLDSNGLAVHSMRSGTYVHPGEQMTCLGCHENKWSAPPVNPHLLAMQRPPSLITPEVIGLEPINYYRHVKPVFRAKCAACHRDSSQGRGPDFSYASLTDYMFGLRGLLFDPMVGGSRVLPGRFGAREARLYKEGYLSAKHHRVKMTEEERRRITLWLDLNCNEYGSYENTAAQAEGMNVWPILDIDTKNLLGVERRGGAFVKAQVSLPSNCFNVRNSAGQFVLTLPSRNACFVRILDLSGRIMLSRDYGPVERILLQTHFLRQGLYLVQIQYSSKTFVKRLTLIK